MMPLAPWFSIVLTLPTATGPLRLSTVVITVTHPVFLAASLRPFVTRFANGCVDEKTS